MLHRRTQLTSFERKMIRAERLDLYIACGITLIGWILIIGYLVKTL